MTPAVTAVLIEKRHDFLRSLTRRLGNADIAEDVLQQFFLRAISKASALKKRECASAWLYQVLNSTLVNYYRDEAARHKGEAEYAQFQRGLCDEFYEDRNTICTCLYRLLPTIKAEYSQVLRRVDLCEEPPVKVANDLGISVNHLRVRLFRARKALKRAVLRSCEVCRQRSTAL